MTIIEQEFYFDGLNGRQGKCHLRVFSRLQPEQQARPIHDDEDSAARQVVVIATEVEDNPSASITNTAAKVAAQVCQHLGVHPSRLVWVEHYDERANAPIRSYAREKYATHNGDDDERFSIVTFDFREARNQRNIGGASLGEPTWKHTTKADIEKLIGETLP